MSYLWYWQGCQFQYVGREDSKSHCEKSETCVSTDFQIPLLLNFGSVANNVIDWDLYENSSSFSLTDLSLLNEKLSLPERTKNLPFGQILVIFITRYSCKQVSDWQHAEWKHTWYTLQGWKQYVSFMSTMLIGLVVFTLYMII